MPQLDVSAWLRYATPYVHQTAGVEALLLFSRTADAFVERLDRFFAQCGLPEGQFALLMMFHTHPQYQQMGMTPAHLATKLHVSRAAVTGLLDSLEKTSLIHRAPNTRDRRSILIQITPAGQQRIEDLAAHYFTFLETLGHELTSPEQRALQQALPPLYAVITDSLKKEVSS